MKVEDKDVTQAIQGSTIEISVKGVWVKVPALRTKQTTIVVQGSWLKVASIHDEAWLETGLEDPELCMKLLRDLEPRGLHADIFTFSQKLPATVPQYTYPVEWDSIAVIPLISFQEWWEKLPQESRKNVRRSQKRGVVVKRQRL